MTMISKAELGPNGMRMSFTLDVDLHSTSSDDPIAYSMGFLAGYAGDPLVPKGEKKKDLAKAYIQGHSLGREVKAGTKPMPAWARLQT